METLLLIARYYDVSIDELVTDSKPHRASETAGAECPDIQILHHLMSKNIPVDFVMELSKADFDFLYNYKELTDENKAEMQYLMNYKLRKQADR